MKRTTKTPSQKQLRSVLSGIKKCLGDIDKIKKVYQEIKDGETHQEQKRIWKRYELSHLRTHRKFRIPSVADCPGAGSNTGNKN